MLLLDPQASGALLRRRLRVGDRGSRKGGDMVREVPGAVAFPPGEGGMPFLCWLGARRAVRAHRPRCLREASRSTWRARAATKGLGGELSAELQGSCSAGRR